MSKTKTGKDITFEGTATVSNSASDRALIEKLVGALKEISEMEGMTLIAPSLGDDCDKAHQIGAAKAFDQAAHIARAALSEAEGNGG